MQFPQELQVERGNSTNDVSGLAAERIANLVLQRLPEISTILPTLLGAEGGDRLRGVEDPCTQAILLGQAWAWGHRRRGRTSSWWLRSGAREPCAPASKGDPKDPDASRFSR